MLHTRNRISVAEPLRFCAGFRPVQKEGEIDLAAVRIPVAELSACVFRDGAFKLLEFGNGVVDATAQSVGIVPTQRETALQKKTVVCGHGADQLRGIDHLRIP